MSTKIHHCLFFLCINIFNIIFSVIFCHLNLLTSSSSLSSCQLRCFSLLCHQQIKNKCLFLPQDHSFIQLPSPKCPNLHIINKLCKSKKHAPNISLLFHWIAMPSFHPSYIHTDSRVRIAHIHFHHHYHPSLFHHHHPHSHPSVLLNFFCLKILSLLVSHFQPNLV